MNAAPPKRPSAGGFIDLSRIRTLVVDDNPNARALLSEVLRGLGVGKVHNAESGQAAMATLRFNEIDIVFADIEMPNQDGLAFVRELRHAANPAIAGVVVVMVSAQATAARVMEAGVSGADSFLCKPYSVSALVRCMNEGFAGRRWAQSEGRPKGLEPKIIDA